MPAQIIDGRALAADLRVRLRARSDRLRDGGVVPRLVVAIVGEDAASLAYVRNLEKVGAAVGVDVSVDALPVDAAQATVRERLTQLGGDRSVHGIILQQPLPPHLSIRQLADVIDPNKDVDGASPVNQGRLAFATGALFVPATPAAVMLLLERSPAWPLRGKHVVVIGRSNVVGLPVSLLILNENATVTVTHKETVDLPFYTRQGEVVVTATGVPRLVTGDLLRPGATVIDVGTTFVDGKLVGDADYESAAAVAGAITPVPGGVGPVTNVALMQNVVTAAERLSGVSDAR